MSEPERIDALEEARRDAVEVLFTALDMSGGPLGNLSREHLELQAQRLETAAREALSLLGGIKP